MDIEYWSFVRQKLNIRLHWTLSKTYYFNALKSLHSAPVLLLYLNRWQCFTPTQQVVILLVLTVILWIISLDAAISNISCCKISNNSIIIYSVLISDWYRYRLKIKAKVSVLYRKWNAESGQHCFKVIQKKKKKCLRSTKTLVVLIHIMTHRSLPDPVGKRAKASTGG